jgi:hypothetical protein
MVFLKKICRNGLRRTNSALYPKAQTSGLSISQIEKVAQQQGYSPAEIARIKERVEKVRTEQNKVLTNVTPPENTSRTQLGQLSEPQPSNIASAIFGKALLQKKD